MTTFFESLWQGLFGDLLFAALLAGWAYVYLKFGWRRLFRMKDASNVTVVVSASAHTDTGSYKRSSTGLGQVRAIADLAPRFAQAYWRQRLDQVFTSEAELHDRATGDLIVLGGEKTNSLAWELLSAWSSDDTFPVTPTEVSNVLWLGTAYGSQGDGHRLSADFGLVIRAPNPFSSHNSRTAILVSGASTAGVHAASQVFARDRWFRRNKHVAALVECRVRDGFPVQVKIVDKMVSSSAEGPWISSGPGGSRGVRSRRVVPRVEVG